MTAIEMDTAITGAKGRWRLDGADPAAILGRLPDMDRVMLAIRQDRMMHERLGVVDRVIPVDGQLHVEGEEQAAELSPDAFASVVLDVTSEMRGKLYPRLEFLDAEEAVLFSVTGLEGPDPMQAALQDLPRTPLQPKERPPREEGEEAQEIDPADPALVLLEQLRETGRDVTIRAELAGQVQLWQGVIEKIVPMGGYINVMTKGFHLHLAGGSVAGWQDEAGGHRALGADGAPLGLMVVPA